MKSRVEIQSFADELLHTVDNRGRLLVQLALSEYRPNSDYFHAINIIRCECLSVELFEMFMLFLVIAFVHTSMQLHVNRCSEHLMYGNISSRIYICVSIFCVLAAILNSAVNK
jgi:hypothetical protein